MKLLNDLPMNQFIEECVSECFSTDQDLIDHYHTVAGTGLENCIQRTLEDIKLASPDFLFNTVNQDGQLVAYFCKDTDEYLAEIFVKPLYRKKEFMKDFWDQIVNSMKDPFYTAIYKKNTPAIEFYSKHGKIIQELDLDDGHAVIFEFKKVGK